MQNEGSKRQRRRRLRARDWEALVEAYEKSGLSQEAFAERNAVSVWSLRRWLLRFRKPAEAEPATRDSGVEGGLRGARSPAAVTMLPVEVLPSKPLPGALLELELEGGSRLRFSVGTDPGYVSGLFAALRQVDAC